MAAQCCRLEAPYNRTATGGARHVDCIGMETTHQNDNNKCALELCFAFSRLTLKMEWKTCGSRNGKAVQPIIFGGSVLWLALFDREWLQLQNVRRRNCLDDICLELCCAQ
eukprot:3686372-Amphidinium_carterae.1